ncbi:MAG: hypothetical protein EHM89_00050 [Acidobacteria bacterium]|nr:MAG: hypothetical protein EHM89_00050 [Acidobacteriota bacterium]
MTRTDLGLAPIDSTTNSPTTPCVEIRSALASQSDRVIAGLNELRTARAMDLRLKHTLTGLDALTPPPSNDWPGPYDFDLGGES